MRIVILAAFFAAAVFAQSAPDTTLPALLNEVQQLRLAIERSTLLGARTQIALQRIQIQEQRTRQLEQDAARARQSADDMSSARVRLETQIKDIEEQMQRYPDPKARQGNEDHLRELKQALAQVGGNEQAHRAREAELSGHLRTEQLRLQDLQSRVDDMEKLLDQAIRQITGQK